MKFFNAKKLKSKDLPELLKFAGKECVHVAFMDQCYTTIIPAFIAQLRNVLPNGKKCLHITGCTNWGDAAIAAMIEWQVREADPEQIFGIVLDHWRQWLVTEDDDQAVLSLKCYFDNLASEIKIPLIVIYRYSL